MSELTDDQKFEMILKTIGSMEEKFEKHFDTLEQMMSEFKQSQEKQDKILERQSRILEALATRSMEQEIEIKELKSDKAS
jgi:hypothetical protein